VYVGKSQPAARIENLLVEDVIDEFALRFYLVAPSLLDPESYDQNREELKDLYLVRPHHGVVHWHALAQSLRQLDRMEEQQRIADAPDVQTRDPLWEQVPTEEIIRRHPGTPIEDPRELKLELWDSDQEFETFVKGIDEARRSDTI